MSREFKIWKDPYDTGFSLYKKSSITLQPGLTVLVGCNGIGKTTLLNCIKDSLQSKEVPVITFNNLQDGGSKAISKAGFYGDMEFMATAICSSEGENIIMNIGNLAKDIGVFVTKNIGKKEIWILLDAVDSGLSIDNVIDVKNYLFKTIIDDTKSKGIDAYIIVSANEYEMANGENCLDVYNCKHVTLSNYDDYKKLILDSAEWKRKRENIKKKRAKRSDISNDISQRSK